MSACPETWNAERVALALEVLHHSGRLRLQLRGLSMLPSLWPGDEVEIASCSPADLKRGDVVLALRNGQFTLHRFLSFSANGNVITCGDAMPGPDPEFSPEMISGRVVLVSRGGRSVTAVQRLLLVRRAVGLLLCYSGLARGIALRFHNWRSGKRPLPLGEATFQREPDEIAETRQAAPLQPPAVNTP